MKCANCGHEINLVEDRKGGAIMECIRMSGRFGQASNLVFEYALLRLGGRSIKEQELKLCRILEGLLKLWESGKFVLQKKQFTISQVGILAALKAVCDRGLKGPLENDNYLKKVMVDISEEEGKTRSIEDEKKLRKRETELRGGRFMDHPESPPATDPGWEGGLKNIGNILKTIGG